MPAAVIYPLAALAEIGGCFAIWSWSRGASALWLLPGVASLAVFGWLLAQFEAGFAGRAFAAYGGVYIAASLLWMWGAEGQRLDLWDLAGAGLCLVGAAAILAAPRAVRSGALSCGPRSDYTGNRVLREGRAMGADPVLKRTALLG